MFFEVSWTPFVQYVWGNFMVAPKMPWAKLPQKYSMAFSTFGGNSHKSTEWHSVRLGESSLKVLNGIQYFWDKSTVLVSCIYCVSSANTSVISDPPPKSTERHSVLLPRKYWIPFSTFRELSPKSIECHSALLWEFPPTHPPKVLNAIQHVWGSLPEQYWMPFSTFGEASHKCTEWHWK